MKKLKRCFLFSLLLVLAIPFLFMNNGKNFAVAATENSIFGKNIYASVSISDQQIDDSELETIDGVTYITTNGSTTINFDYLKYNYIVTPDNMDNYYTNTREFVIERNSETGILPTTFDIDDVTYEYSISEGTITIYEIIPGITYTQRNPRLHSEYSNLLSFTESADTITISIITSYTLDGDAPTSRLTYSVYNYQTKISGEDDIVLCFDRPVLNFNQNSPISFECSGIDAGDTPYIDTMIPQEHSYAGVKLTFKNNNYTENNPLYFDINHNGFVYTYKLYSKNINSSDLLFIEYFDEDRPKNNQSLATKLTSEGNVETAVYKYNGGSNFNEFTINFNKTGRYEVAVYDKTYTLELNNSNYYTTSFYIKNENAGNTAFENVYVIFQTMEDDGVTPIDYIVSESTLNNSVKINIKNLSFYFEKDTALANEDIVMKFIVTSFTGSDNLPTETVFTKAQLMEMLDKNGDLTNLVTEDAFYEIELYQYKIEDFLEGGVPVSKKVLSGTQKYNFSVVKKPKTSYTKYLTNSEYEVVYDDVTGKPKTVTKVADVPYVIVRDNENYRNIKSQMLINIKFSTHILSSDVTLEKAYINNYYIDYAMQEVRVDEYDEYEPESDKVLEQLNLRFSGIGDIVVTITVNGVTTTQTLTQETGFTLTFKDYGVYQISFVDSMGTVGTGEFSFKKPVSTSSILLIALVGVIVLAVVIFVVVSRSKLKTR